MPSELFDDIVTVVYPMQNFLNFAQFLWVSHIGL